MARRSRWVLSALVSVSVALFAGPAAAEGIDVADDWVRLGDDAPAWEFGFPRKVWEGVDITTAVRSDPVVAHVAHVHPDAPVDFDAVVSNEAIGQGRETVSSMCAREFAALCVNANYPICWSCVSPHGAVVRDRRFMVSVVDHQWQVWTRNGRFTSELWTDDERLEVAGASPPQELVIDALNQAPHRDRLVLLNSDWGTTTGAPSGSYEVIFGAPVPLWVGGVRQPAVLRGVSTTGDTPIPRDGFVLTGRGPGADALWAFIDAHWAEPLNLVVSTPADVDDAISGHPRLQLDGVRQTLDPDDGKVVERHPRTVVGWNDAGDVWLVVIDGRQRASKGLDLWETTEFMELLGATTSVNLDGGGSSAMAYACGGAEGWCVKNRPSDGQERLVSTALAVIPR